ncbi:MAG: glycosyltransferase family 2 protein [Sphingobacteriales bacterium]|nr:MAG: glycosyltransferase family 2 protein [Sphingobacteriales bacterium]
MEQKLVSIITVNYNQPQVTEALLQSIADHNTYRNIEIIVVDNASKTDPVPGWKLQYPDITFIRSEENLGFAGGNNLGIKEAKGDYLFLVNNDTEFTPGLVASMVNYMERNTRIGIASPKICYYDQPETLQYAGFTPMNYYTCRNACVGQYEQDKGQFDDRTGTTGYIHGAAMMVRHDVVEQAGMMAENYFLYYEEMDWCDRIKAKGYQASVNMQALIYHKESVSVGKKTVLKEYFMTRNRILFIRKNTSPLTCFVFCCYFLAVVAPRNIFRYVVEKEYSFINAFFKGIWWNLTHRTHSNDLGYRFN